MAGDPRPTIRLNVLNDTRWNSVRLPGNARRIKGNTINSTNNDGRHFRNAKKASRAEEGLKLVETYNLGIGTEGILEKTDGIRIKVKVIKDLHLNPQYKQVYILRDEDGEEYIMDIHERFTVWDFYTFMKPIPFVPKTRRNRKTRTLRKQTKSQRKCA